MSLSRDQQRILQMDQEIRVLQRLYEEELQHEVVVNKRTLLLSRSYKLRLDKLQRARNALNIGLDTRLTKNASYAMELAQRKEAVANAEQQCKDIQNQINALVEQAAQLTALNMPMPDALDYNLKYLVRDMPKARTALRNRQQALDNHIINGKMKAAQASKNKLPKNYNAEEDADAFELPEFYGSHHNDEIINTAKAVIAGTYQPKVDLNLLNTKVDLSMFTRPEELAVFEQNKSEVNLDADINEPTVEELEERQLKEMHETKYQPPMID